MVVPLVGEEEWQDSLRDLPPFERTADRIVLISPHPDDETLSAGGYLAAEKARGVEILVVAVTDGENAYPDIPGLAAVRRAEQEAALERLGVPRDSIRRFCLVDSGVEAQKERLVELLLPLVNDRTHILAPWTEDFHPDHEACGWAAEQVALRMHATLSWYFFWTWHRGTPAHLEGVQLRAYKLDAGLLTKKLSALSCHRSQLEHASGEPILPEGLLGPARRGFEVFAYA